MPLPLDGPFLALAAALDSLVTGLKGRLTPSVLVDMCHTPEEPQQSSTPSGSCWAGHRAGWLPCAESEGRPGCEAQPVRLPGCGRPGVGTCAAGPQRRPAAQAEARTRLSAKATREGSVTLPAGMRHMLGQHQRTLAKTQCLRRERHTPPPFKSLSAGLCTCVRSRTPCCTASHWQVHRQCACAKILGMMNA